MRRISALPHRHINLPLGPGLLTGPLPDRRSPPSTYPVHYTSGTGTSLASLALPRIWHLHQHIPSRASLQLPNITPSSAHPPRLTLELLFYIILMMPGRGLPPFPILHTSPRGGQSPRNGVEGLLFLESLPPISGRTLAIFAPYHQIWRSGRTESPKRRAAPWKGSGGELRRN